MAAERDYSPEVLACKQQFMERAMAGDAHFSPIYFASVDHPVVVAVWSCDGNGRFMQDSYDYVRLISFLEQNPEVIGGVACRELIPQVADAINHHMIERDRILHGEQADSF